MFFSLTFVVSFSPISQFLRRPAPIRVAGIASEAELSVRVRVSVSVYAILSASSVLRTLVVNVGMARNICPHVNHHQTPTWPDCTRDMCDHLLLLGSKIPRIFYLENDECEDSAYGM
jgi:hypothetical protein